MVETNSASNIAVNRQDNVRDLILRFGWNSTCYQLLNPGFDYWFSRAGDAVVGFVEFAGTRIVGGSPICSLDRLPDVVDEFEAESHRNRFRVCYFASEARLESVIAHRPGYSIVQLGAQPIWKPASLIEKINLKPSLRGQLNRAFNKSVTIEEWNAERTFLNPELKRLLDYWLQTRGLPSLHFLVEPETLARVEDRRMFVAVREGRPVGFLNASPIPERHGWLIEQFVRGPDAPNGTVESMLFHAAEALAEDGYDYLTLGLSPLTHEGQMELPAAPPIVRFLLGLARAHGKRFYNFTGLEFFKMKFEPEEWEPIFAISRESYFSIRTLYAIADAFTSGHTFQTLGLGVLRAIRQEIRNVAKV